MSALRLPLLARASLGLTPILGALASAALGVACGGNASSGPADASSEVTAVSDAGADVAVLDTSTPSLPPSPDCRYIDDTTTCVDTYILPGTYLYACGELALTDGFDGGTNRPYPPPLPPSYDCRNVSPPVLDAGLAQIGALWCCNAPAACARALTFDVTCGAGSVAYSCPSAGVFPPGSSGGGRCAPAPVADAGLALTPPLAVNEALLCCPPQ